MFLTQNKSYDTAIGTPFNNGLGFNFINIKEQMKLLPLLILLLPNF
jgi:hypothetical protein